MKNVLVIGSTGQIGSELTMQLRKIYHQGRIVAGYIPGSAPTGDLLESGPAEQANVCNAQQIAEMPMIDSGTIPGGSIASGAYADWDVVFTKPFTAKPNVTVGFMTNAEQGNFGRCWCAVLMRSLTKTGFTLRVYNGDAQGRSPRCNWVAVGR